MGIFDFWKKAHPQKPVPPEPAVTVADSVSPENPTPQPPSVEPEKTYILRLVDEATGNSVCAPFPGTAKEQDIIRYLYAAGVLTPFPQSVKVREWYQSFPYPRNLRDLNPAHLETLHIGVQLDYLPYLQYRGHTDNLYKLYSLAFRMPDGDVQTFDCMGYETPSWILSRMEKTGFLNRPEPPCKSGFFSSPSMDTRYSWEIQGWPGVDMDTVEQMQLDWPELRFYRMMSGAPVCDFAKSDCTPFPIVRKEEDPRDYVCLYGCPRAEGAFRRDSVLQPQVDVIDYA